MGAMRSIRAHVVWPLRAQAFDHVDQLPERQTQIEFEISPEVRSKTPDDLLAARWYGVEKRCFVGEDYRLIVGVGFRDVDEELNFAVPRVGFC